MMKWNALLASSLLFLAACAGSKYPYEPQFVAPADMSARILPEPPRAGSIEFEKEINYIVARQKHLSAHDRQTIEAENHITPEMIVLPVLGTHYTRDNYPALYALLAHAASDAWRLADTNQDYWKSPRPWMADKNVELIAPRITSYGYPSGHTTTNRVWAYVLSEAFPGKKDAFFARAEQIAQHRMQGGVHFPHDLEGGRKLSTAIFAEMKANPKFQYELAEAKREIRAHAPHHRVAPKTHAKTEKPVVKKADAEAVKAEPEAPKRSRLKFW
jgi:acid phosphatase (class A)